jgi:hypothetical protein
MIQMITVCSHKLFAIFLEKNFLTLNFFRNVKILRLEFEWMLKKMSNFYLLQAGLQVNHQDHQKFFSRNITNNL